MLINPQSFAGRSSSSLVGGLMDLAPTILDILGIATPDLWQGRSLFAIDHPDRAYFFSPWNGFKMGYREGSKKFIYNSDSGHLEAYDLHSDPNETLDLFKEDPIQSHAPLKKLGAWAKGQVAFMEEVKLAANVPETVAGGSVSKVRIFATGTSFITTPRARVDVDGTTIGFFDVEASPKNATQPAAQAEIDRAVSEFEFPLGPGACPRTLKIEFLNDEWDAQTEIGDTNLFITGAIVNGVEFSPEDFKIDTPETVSKTLNSMALWGLGSIHLDLDAVRICG